MESFPVNASVSPGRKWSDRAMGARHFMDQTAEILRATGVLDRGMNVGDKAPELILPGAGGEMVALSDLWRRGPVVVIFYRGEWCRICMRQLRTWQAASASLDRLGASVIAISPEPAEGLQHTIRAHGLSYMLLSDPALHAANAFNVAMSLPPELVDLYAQVGADAAVLNEDGQWELPVPATFVVGGDGRILFARVDLDAWRRTRPEEVFQAIRDMGADGPKD